jgi:hypothetical protein
MAEDYIITPGGYRRASLVHLIEKGHHLDGTNGHFKKLDPNRKVIADFGQIEVRPTQKPLMPANVVATDPSKRKTLPALGTGWITYAFWNNSTGKPITSFKTTWRVPPDPMSNDGQLIYLFNGIQNSTMIYQPVLQWGNNGAFGGNYWCVASWYADGQNGQAFYSQNSRVSVNQALVGLMTQTGSANGQFSYNCIFEGIANSALPIQNVQELTWCAETLEAYGVQKSSDYPAAGKCAMTAIEIITQGDAGLNWTPETPVSDTGQHTVVVSNANPNGEVDLYFNRLDDWIVDKTIISNNTSPKNPSIASLNGRLYIAWKGDGNDHINVMYSTDNGATFGNKYTSPETSPQAPALCAHNGKLYIAWKGDGNDHLNVASVNFSGNAITGFSKVVLGDTSPVSPTLASFNGRLYLAWKGDGNDNLNVMYSTDNGATFGHKYTSPETSPQAPGLTASAGNLFITWKGDGNDQLNVATVNISGAAITGFSKVILGDTSPVSPALAYLNGRLYLSWKGDGNDWLNVEYSTDNGRTFGSKAVSSETSPQPPALCVHNGAVYVAWKGDGNDFLNVAQVSA